jgi:hypothetical protein
MLPAFVFIGSRPKSPLPILLSPRYRLNTKLLGMFKMDTREAVNDTSTPSVVLVGVIDTDTGRTVYEAEEIETRSVYELNMDCVAGTTIATS